MTRATVLALLALAAAGCGTPSADLFVVERSGDVPDANLKLLVSDGTSVECDGQPRKLTSAQLIDAREITGDLEPLLRKHLTLRPGRQSILRFKVTAEHGTVAFSDSSTPLPQVFANLIRLTRTLAREACGKQR